MDRDEFFGSLQKKDEIIVRLKDALLEKDRVIADLESALLDVSGRAGPATLSYDGESLTNEPLTAADRGLKSSLPFSLPSGWDDHVSLGDSTGFFDDGWLSHQAELRFHESCAGKTVTFSFYLPERDGLGPKTIEVEGNFTDALRIEVTRDKITQARFDVPASFEGSPCIRMRCGITEPPQSRDARSLGTLVSSIVVADRPRASK